MNLGIPADVLKEADLTENKKRHVTINVEGGWGCFCCSIGCLLMTALFCGTVFGIVWIVAHTVKAIAKLF